MKERKLALLDPDHSFVSRLAHYINRKENVPLAAWPFTEASRLADYVQGHPLSVLLVGEELLEECVSLRPFFEKILVLGGGGEGVLREPAQKWGTPWKTAVITRDRDTYVCIYRYQPADELVRCVLKNIEPAREEGERAVKHIGICSPVGRCGKTGFAVALGLQLAQSQRVLYLNLERYHGLPVLCGASRQSKDLSDLLYRLRTLTDGSDLALEEFVCRLGDLDYIMPGRSAAYLNEMDAAEWRQVLEAIDCADYESIVLDFDPAFAWAGALLLSCTTVFVPCHNDPVSDMKIRQFMEDLEASAQPAFSAHVHALRLPRIDYSGQTLSTSRAGFVSAQMASFCTHLIREKGLL